MACDCIFINEISHELRFWELEKEDDSVVEERNKNWQIVRRAEIEQACWAISSSSSESYDALKSIGLTNDWVWYRSKLLSIAPHLPNLLHDSHEYISA